MVQPPLAMVQQTSLLASGVSLVLVDALMCALKSWYVQRCSVSIAWKIPCTCVCSAHTVCDMYDVSPEAGARRSHAPLCACSTGTLLTRPRVLNRARSLLPSSLPARFWRQQLHPVLCWYFFSWRYGQQPEPGVFSLHGWLHFTDSWRHKLYRWAGIRQAALQRIHMWRGHLSRGSRRAPRPKSPKPASTSVLLGMYPSSPLRFRDHRPPFVKL